MAHIKVLVVIKDFDNNKYKNDKYGNDFERFFRTCDDKLLNSIIGDTYKTKFSRAVASIIDKIITPYSTLYDNQEDLEFDDHTSEVIRDYNHNRIKCCLNPDGSIMKDPPEGFIYLKDSIYALKVGKTHSVKKNKKSKKFKIKDVKVNKVFDNVGDYALYNGYSYNDDGTKFGWYYNPNSRFTEYSIGGRFYNEFVVKNECSECFSGSFYDNSVITPPEGYKFCSVCRFKDIEWDVIKNIILDDMEYYKSKNNEIPDKISIIIESEFGGIDKLNKSIDKIKESKYPIYFSNIVSDNGWDELECLDTDIYDKFDDMMDEFKDDDIFAIIDAHI